MSYVWHALGLIAALAGVALFVAMWIDDNRVDRKTWKPHEDEDGFYRS